MFVILCTHCMYFVYADFNLLLSTWRTFVFIVCVMFLLGFYKAAFSRKTFVCFYGDQLLCIWCYFLCLIQLVSCNWVESINFTSMIIDTNACNYNHLIYTFKLFSTFSQQQEYLFIIMIQTLKMKEFRFLIH